MHVHILGICGSFMGGIAAIAKSLGHKVTGSDKNVYPPMSTQLEALGIELTEGYCESQFDPAPDMVVIGNAMSRQPGGRVRAKPQFTLYQRPAMASR